MKLHPLCINCFLRQALEAATMATEDSVLREKTFRSALGYAYRTDWSTSIPEFGTRIHEIVKNETENCDPYTEEKKIQNELGQRLYKRLKRYVDGSDDPLHQSAKVAIVGNVIDLAPRQKIDLEKEIRECLEKPLDIDEFRLLRRELEKNRRLLYLADNAGEVFFDRIFIENLVDQGIDVTYVVKGGPILNDATLRDAYSAGIQDITHVITNGAAAIGTQLNLCSPEFRSIFDETPLVISKGQGNYESLDEIEGKTIFFLLKAKCPVIAENLEVPLGTTILKSSMQQD
jgi:uncharacterized protein with ATP-grasp and redox domains